MKSASVTVLNLANFAVCLVSVFTLHACKSRQEKVIDLRTKARANLDSLYGAYGGGIGVSMAKQVAKDVESNGGESDPVGALKQGLVNSIVDADREDFELQCLRLGRGDRPELLTDKARTFFALADTQHACRDVVVVRSEADQLEAEGTP